MTKHRRTRRRQKGGFWGSTSSTMSNGSSESFLSGIGNWFSNIGTKAKEATTSALNTAESAVGTGYDAVLNTAQGVKNSTSNLVQGTSSSQPIYSSGYSSSQPIYSSGYSSSQPVYGGKRRRYSRRIKGGKGGLGLTYYAAPVAGLKVAEPDSWQYYANGTNQYSVKGGSRKRKTRKNRRNRK